MAIAGGGRDDEVGVSEDEYLPDKPQEPLPSDCCGTGCSPCVMDLYHEEMERWLKLKAMSKQEREQWWKERSSSHHITVLTPDTFIGFPVTNIIQITQDSFLYSFKLPENQYLGLRPGQHIIMRLINEFGESVTRQYTPVSSSQQRGSFDVLIKLYSDGRMSQIIKQSIQIGSTVEWRGPFGEFQYQSNQYRELVMLACGTGITPMIQCIRTVLDNEDDFTRLTLLYAVRHQHDILMKSLLDEFCDYWNFKVTYYLSQCRETLDKDKGLVRHYSDVVKFGRIGFEELKLELDKSGGDKGGDIKVEGRLFLVCGTKSFDKDMIKYLLKMNYSQKEIFKFYILYWSVVMYM